MIDATDHISLAELAAALPPRLGRLCLGALKAAGIDDHRALCVIANLTGEFTDPADIDGIIRGTCNAVGAISTGWPYLDIPHTIAAGQAVAHLSVAMCQLARSPTLYAEHGRVMQ